MALVMVGAAASIHNRPKEESVEVIMEALRRAIGGQQVLHERGLDGVWLSMSLALRGEVHGVPVLCWHHLSNDCVVVAVRRG